MERKIGRRLGRNYRRLISRNCRKPRAMISSLSAAARRLPADQLPQRCNKFRELRPDAAIVTKSERCNAHRGLIASPGWKILLASTQQLKTGADRPLNKRSFGRAVFFVL